MKERGGALWPCVDEVRTDLASKIRLLRCFVPSHLVPLPVWNADEAIAQQLQVVLLQQGAPRRPKESLPMEGSKSFGISKRNDGERNACPGPALVRVPYQPLRPLPFPHFFGLGREGIVVSSL